MPVLGSEDCPCDYCGEFAACVCASAEWCPDCGEYWKWCECIREGVTCRIERNPAPVPCVYCLEIPCTCIDQQLCPDCREPNPLCECPELAQEPALAGR